MILLQLQANVFWAYLAVDDEKFVRLAEQMQDKWTNAATTPFNTYMIRAENEYNTRIQMGTWKAPTKKDMIITALKATVENMSSGKKNAEDNPNATPKKSNTTPNKSYEERLKNERKKSPWKFKAPSKNDNWSKQMNNNTYNWCSKHQKWVTTHTDADCAGINVHPRDYSGKNNATPKVAFAAEKEPKGKEVKEDDEPEVKVNRALMTFVRDASSLF
jgi:hypothetical protein